MAKRKNVKGADIRRTPRGESNAAIIPPTVEEDKRINRGIASDPETFEWTAKDFARAQPVAEIFPDLAAYSIKRKRGQRGPQKAPTKKPVKLRVDPEVLAWYQATGAGWQTRMQEALRRGMKEAR
jgi:uncharacterized protein (DUF4415 family)